MSLETWMKQFYPVHANGVEEEDAIKHSLKKWTGLRATNLEKHGLTHPPQSAEIYDSEGNSLNMTCSTCALCAYYLDHRSYGYDENCTKCPLFKVLNNNACDSAELGGGPYSEWVRRGNAEPMIKALRKALKLQQQKPKKVSRDGRKKATPKKDQASS